MKLSGFPLIGDLEKKQAGRLQTQLAQRMATRAWASLYLDWKDKHCPQLGVIIPTAWDIEFWAGKEASR